MKVLNLSTFDTAGGAARAAYRMHQGLGRIGVDSRMLVQIKSENDPTVMSLPSNLDKGIARIRTALDTLPLRAYSKRKPTMFSPQWLPDAIAPQIAQLAPDIVSLHWVCAAYLRVETLAKLNKPIVWTLQDMWAFTGGCHYTQGCDRYTDSCGACPQLNAHKSQDLSHWVWQRKARAWKDINLTIAAPSSWMAKCASSSSLFKELRVEVIPFGLDTRKFKPVERRIARDLLDLPQEKQLVLFGAIAATDDTRKGFHLLQPALRKLSQSGWKDRIELVVFGSSGPASPLDLGFRSHYLGRLQDEISLRLAYSAADVMVAPSIQEAFGQTASESFACGTPVLVFNDTGLTEIVDHQQNGYVANHCDIEDLAQGIVWILEDRERHQKLCNRAREKAEQEFTLERQANRYLSLFNEILS